MSKGHMIMLGGVLEREDTSESRNQAKNTRNDEVPSFWPSVKRSAGGHRIATYLREEGYDVEVLDYWPKWTEEDLNLFFEQRVRDDTICVGLSAMFPLGGTGKENQMKVQEMVQVLHRLKAKYPKLVWVGGAQNISAVLAYPLDYYVGGYGEYAIIDLLKYLKGEPNTLKIHKRTYWGAERTVIECRKDYPAFPMPNANVKYEDRDYIQQQEVLTLEMGRGCKFKCKFCSFTVLGVKDDYSRCGESLGEELTDNYNRWGTTCYTVSDETINDSPEKLAKHAKVIKKLPFDVHLSGFVRGDLLAAKPDTWQDIWDMGLRSQFYGLETFNHEAGKFVGKGMNPDRLKEGLIKAQDWFRAKGQYRCTISMIIGIPGETRETFLDGVEWVKKNFPGHSYSFAPLYIAGGDMKDMMTNPSEFDLTWRESGKFREMTHEEMGVDYSEIREEIRPFAQFYLESPGVVNWGHDTMNIWEAFKIFNEMIDDDELTQNLAAGIFYYHRYMTTGKYTIDDMYSKRFSRPGSNDGIQPLNIMDIADHNDFIDDYIEKKLGRA